MAIKDKKIPFYIILPETLFRKIWNMLILVLMIYTGTLLPYILVFEDDSINTEIIDNIMFYVFILDIFITFVSA